MLTSRGFSLQSGSLIMLLASSIMFPYPPLVLLFLFVFFTSSFHAIITHSSYLSKISPEDFTVKRSISSVFSHPEKEIDVEIEVAYKGKLRIFCIIEDSLSTGLRISGSSSWSGTLDASSVKIAYSVTTSKRGVYNVGPVGIKVMDAHGLCFKEIKVGSAAELVFMPVIGRIKEASRAPKVPSLLFRAGSSTNPFTGLEEDFMDVREYVPGDKMRHIDWKAVARSSKNNQIYVRRFERQEQADVLFILRGSPLEEVNERLVEATSRLSKFFINAGDRVALVAEAENIVSIAPSGGKVQLRKIMRGLAGATHVPEIDALTTETSKILAKARKGSIVIVVGWPEKELLHDIVETCQSKRHKAFILTPTYSSIAELLNMTDSEVFPEEADAVWEKALTEGKLKGIVVVRAAIGALEESMMEVVRFMRYRRGFAA